MFRYSSIRFDLNTLINCVGRFTSDVLQNNSYQTKVLIARFYRKYFITSINYRCPRWHALTLDISPTMTVFNSLMIVKVNCQRRSMNFNFNDRTIFQEISLKWSNKCQTSLWNYWQLNLKWNFDPVRLRSERHLRRWKTHKTWTNAGFSADSARN